VKFCAVAERMAGIRNPWHDLENTREGAATMAGDTVLLAKYQYLIGISWAIAAAVKAAPSGAVLAAPDIVPHLKCPVKISAKNTAAYIDAMRALLERRAARLRVLDDGALIVSED
jgi:hypothetical protein